MKHNLLELLGSRSAIASGNPRICGTTDIERVTKRSKLTGKYLHAVGYRLYFDNKDYVQKNKNLIDNPNQMMEVE